MSSILAHQGSGSPKNRRRRVGHGGSTNTSGWLGGSSQSTTVEEGGTNVQLSSAQSDVGKHNASTNESGTNPYIEDGDYYDDSDGQIGGVHGNNNVNNEKNIYKGSCSFGQFVLNPCLCICLSMKSFFVQTLYRRYLRTLIYRAKLLRNIILKGRRSSHYYQQMGYSSQQQHKRQQNQQRFDVWIDLLLLLSAMISFSVFVSYLLPPLSFFSKSTRRRGLSPTPPTSCGIFYSCHRQLGRPYTDMNVDNLEILIPKYDINYEYDPGGWMYRRQFWLPSPPEDSMLMTFGSSSQLNDEPRSAEPDYGDIAYTPVLSANTTGSAIGVREISPDDRESYEKFRNGIIKDFFAHPVPQAHLTAEDLEDTILECKRPNWYYTYNPNCNSFHDNHMEIDYNIDNTFAAVVPPSSESKGQKGKNNSKIGDGFEEKSSASLGGGTYEINDQVLDSFYISHGYYRDVWVFDQPDLEVKCILKRSRYSFDFTIKTFHTTLRDALIMERLSGSPRIVDLYGHCGSSVIVEAIPFEVEEYIVPNGYIKQVDLQDADEVKPQNSYNAAEKLGMALEMAESLADLHGFPDGVIVHDDVQLCQWLRLPNGKLKLGDFNRAEIMTYNVEKQQYCKYNNGRSYGNYRAPEEFDSKDLDEQIDVFTMGNNIYALLTGLWVFYENQDDNVVQKKVINGELPYVDPRYKQRSFAESQLVEVMEKCWVYDPEKRIDIFEVVRLLRKAVAENDKLPQQ